LIVSCHQPDYAPWLGYFSKISQSDLFIIMDDVAFNRRGFTRRNKIRTPQGWMWLTTPVKYAPLGTPIRKIELRDNGWNQEHWKHIFHNYRGARHFDEMQSLKEIYEESFNNLDDLNTAIITWAMEKNNSRVPVLKQSELCIDPDLKKTDLLIALVKAVGGDAYLSGTGAKAYIYEAAFKKEGIRLMYQEFKHPIYPQRYPGFVSNLSFMDYFFNVGSYNSKITQGAVPLPTHDQYYQ
jgi:hypothetical protein